MSDINNVQINDVNYTLLDEELTEIKADLADIQEEISGLDALIGTGVIE